VPESATVFDAFVQGIERAAQYDKNDQVAPEVVIWTDREGRWADAVERLRERLPLLSLGGYEPERRVGPAYWIRCMLAGVLHDRLPEGPVPVLYLNGVSREELRAVEDCPKALQPIVELQYRGAFWTHPNGRDWTVSGFLRNQANGLGLEVIGGAASREAAQGALVKLLDETVEGLRQRSPLTAADFNELLSPDPARRILEWIQEPSALHESIGADEWEAFLAQCKNDYGLDPEEDGPIEGALRLGERLGSWKAIWDRFAEAPARYPAIPERLLAAKPVDRIPNHLGSWPQGNEESEAKLRSALEVLAGRAPQEVRKQLQILEKEHGERRTWVWAQLGQAPLAQALQYLAELSHLTEHQLAGASASAIVEEYATKGWTTDHAMISALRSVDSQKDGQLIRDVADVLYRPWVEGGALELQKAVAQEGIASAYPVVAPPAAGPGTCFLFSDGLRLDLGHDLAARLEKLGAMVEVGTGLAALPTVTSTAKPAVTPVAGKLAAGPSLDPSSADGGARANMNVLRKLMEQEGIQILGSDEVGDPTGVGWAELGDIDSVGHNHGLKLPSRIDAELALLAERIIGLLEAGWSEVRVVTDHGWLLIPSGLPKVELPKHLAVAAKGRAARLKEESSVEAQVVPWHWDDAVRIALAPGIGCFVAGKHYEHGGLSPQECVVPTVIARRGHKGGGAVTLGDVSWTRMRCRIQLSGSFQGSTVDLRTKPGDASSSLLNEAKSVDEEGRVAVVVPDPDQAGVAASVVVLGPNGDLVAQTLTTVGGEG
jgi:hypothetical protein